MCNRVKVAGPTREGSNRGKSIDWIVSKKTKKDILLKGNAVLTSMDYIVNDKNESV